MKRVVHGVNGIRDDGSASTDALLGVLADRGHETNDINYPRVGLLRSLLGLRKITRRMSYDRAEYLQRAMHDDGKNDVIAHSYGCLLTLRAMERGARFGVVIWIAPAMDADFVIPAWGCETLYIIHCPDDRALKAGSSLLFHDFGRMGLDGSAYAEFDDRVTNIKVDLHAHEYADFFRHSYAFSSAESLNLVAQLYESALEA